MNQTEKAQFVEQIRERFTSSPLVILTDWKGCTVAEMDALRRACDEADVHFQVVKNTLARRALEGTDKAFAGAWGVWPFGDDELIVVSDMNAGLFLFRHHPIRVGRDDPAG